MEVRTKGWEPLGSMAAPSMPVTKRRREKSRHDFFFAKVARGIMRQFSIGREPCQSLAHKRNISEFRPAPSYTNAEKETCSLRLKLAGRVAL